MAGTRGLPESVLVAASRADAVREGAHGSAWFAHRDQTGVLTGIEMRGPDWRGFAKHAIKSLFRLPGSEGELTRVAVCESPIDALSLAAIESMRRDTLYAATTGGMEPETLACLRALLQALAGHPNGILIAATDADRQGHRYADQLAAMAAAAGVRSERVLPPGGHNDWNDALVARRGASRVWHVRTAPERPRAARAASGQGAGGLSSGQGRIRSPMTTPGARGAAARQGSEEE